MSPLLIPLVESRVGALITAWPRVVLQVLFNFTAPATTVFDTESLTAFLYGNGVHFHMAEQLVRACTTGASDLINFLHSLYANWIT
jgi:hypothetical protein